MERNEQSNATNSCARLCELDPFNARSQCAIKLVCRSGG
jgi:hypothetical protein